MNPGRVRIECVHTGVVETEADLLLVPCHEGRKFGPEHSAIESALGWSPARLLEENGLSGRIGDFVAVPTGERARAGSIGLLGLGPRAAPTPASIRSAAMVAAKRIARFRSVATTVHRAALTPSDSAHALVEGLLLGMYAYSRHVTEPVPGETCLRLLCEPDNAAVVADAAATGLVYAGATNWARDLVDGPPGLVTPAALAAEATEIAGRYASMSARIWAPDDLARDGFGGITAVGAGSANTPRLIELAHMGRPGGPWHAPVGKGVTFDSGGLDIKAPERMLLMKTDMAGGAAALAAVQGAAELGLELNVVAVVPAVENALGPDAYRPGDVVRHRNGVTTEIVSTDAEGRLILADALAYAAERGPAAMIDLATLTSAILGEDCSPVFGTDPALVNALRAAGEEEGEPLWEMPLLQSCRGLIESRVADLKNMEFGIACGTVTGAIFLREFVGEVPWAHIDIVGTAYHPRPAGTWPAGATGAGTRTVLRYLQSVASGRPA
jgi:leucyl aminopeptidase